MDTSPTNILLALEALRQLKARYCRFVDTKQWDNLVNLFTDDARLDGFSSVPDGTDPKTFVTGISQLLDAALTIHHVQAPEIELVGLDVAHGIWSMTDYVDLQPDGKSSSAAKDRGWIGWGYYEESYARVDGQWLFSYMRLTRQRMDWLTPSHTAAQFGRHGPSKDWLGQFTGEPSESVGANRS